MKTLSLPKGTTGFWNDANQWVCTGSAMGRRDVLPASTSPKLRMRRLPFVDGAYDRWGAYWGGPANVWCAWDEEGTRIFIRGETRYSVKNEIRKNWPHARFYR